MNLEPGPCGLVVRGPDANDTSRACIISLCTVGRSLQARLKPAADPACTALDHVSKTRRPPTGTLLIPIGLQCGTCHFLFENKDICRASRGEQATSAIGIAVRGEA